MELSVDQIKRIIEASLLMNREPQPAKKLAELFTPEEDVNERAIIDTLTILADDYRGRGIELVEVASGYRFQVCSDLSPWIQRTMEEKPQRYSRALLETLALIAYRQPITRAEIEEVRGVVVSTQIMRTLEEREWVRVIGHRDVPGRPALYATTKQFLNDLNLKSLGELPTLAELQDLDKIDGEIQQLNLDIAIEQEKSPELSDDSNEIQNESNGLQHVDQETISSDDRVMIVNESQDPESGHNLSAEEYALETSNQNVENATNIEPEQGSESSTNHNGDNTMDQLDDEFDVEEINELTEISWTESQIGSIDEEEEEFLTSDETNYDEESELSDAASENLEETEETEETDEAQEYSESDENEWGDEELELEDEHELTETDV